MKMISTDSARKKKIKKVLSMMNKQNERFLVVAPPLVEMMNMSTEDSELDFLIQMGTGHYSYEDALKQSRMSHDRFESFFETLQKKGLVHAEKDEEGRRAFRLNAIAVGWYEAMMHYLVGKPEEKAFSEKWQEYFNFFKKFTFPPLRNIQNALMRPILKPAQSVGILAPATPGKSKKKTIPVNGSLSSPETQVYPTSFINNLVEHFGNQDAICAFPCVCRHGNALLDDPCNQNMPKESCIAFGEMAKAWESFGYGRSVSKSEAMEILKEVRDKGAVHSVIHEKDDPNLPVVAICNCCWDCCGILKPYNMGAVSLNFKSYFVARIRDETSCKGCGVCEKYCPTTAISISEKQPNLNIDKCIGCGQCAYQCRFNNIELVPCQRDVFLPILRKSEVRISA